MSRLSGKVAVVTGAGSGIGRAAALRFAAEGARVVCADISGHENDVAAAEQQFGRLDVMFNNVGAGGPRRPLADYDEADYDEVVDLNLRSTFLGMKHAIPAMLRSGGGSIINTASAAGLVGWKHLALYSAAKGGVVQMTKAAALDYATSAIRVDAICPGMTWTGLASASARADADPGSSAPRPTDPPPPQPMQRWGLPEEVAAAALFLASDESSFVTGTAIPVDGGYVAR